MNYRVLGKTGMKVSEISLGTWQVGGGWGGSFDQNKAREILNNAIDQGINFIDTADVYDMGKSEAAVGEILKERSEKIFVATKCGRQIDPHVNEGYTPQVLRKYVEDSLKNMGLETLDLIQLHCPPTSVYQRDEIFELFDRLKEEGKVRNLGVSVEKVEEAMMAVKYPNVCTVQVIFNMFRQKPMEEFFPIAKENNVGVIVRVPLASGMLSGKMSASREFDPGDHRNFNREGQAFDKGETFSGVNFEKGLEAVEALKEIFKGETSLALWALRWILMFDEVSTVIPGASRAAQVSENAKASQLPEIPLEKMEAVKDVYEKYIKADVHHLW
ncbi:aldo/keto reductase [Echinicola jeungdonensis]|uniref:Aldo/keto reductase n=1 Tax=Echinicola jeungdonensis TaxID=709343 RepID=A0ABV5J0Q5_9BACT|nr:aldo/keto reductase [Echinicola jeungdonensis]MDN3667841.1 aldo/keto reductase [Echinicola jeungdonensis]